MRCRLRRQVFYASQLVAPICEDSDRAGLPWAVGAERIGDEELILCRRDEEQIEIHCHGGAAAVEAVIDRLVNEGCQRITWQDWIARPRPIGFTLRPRSRWPDAVTDRTAAILLDQLNGALAEADSAQ